MFVQLIYDPSQTDILQVCFFTKGAAVRYGVGSISVFLIPVLNCLERIESIANRRVTCTIQVKSLPLVASYLSAFCQILRQKASCKTSFPSFIRNHPADDAKQRRRIAFVEQSK